MSDVVETRDSTRRQGRRAADELPIVVAWPVAGGRDGRRRRRTESPSVAALRSSVTFSQGLGLIGSVRHFLVPTGLCLACWMRGSSFFFALLGGAVAPAGPQAVNGLG